MTHAELTASLDRLSALSRASSDGQVRIAREHYAVRATIALNGRDLIAISTSIESALTGLAQQLAVAVEHEDMRP